MKNIEKMGVLNQLNRQCSDLTSINVLVSPRGKVLIDQRLVPLLKQQQITLLKTTAVDTLGLFSSSVLC